MVMDDYFDVLVFGDCLLVEIDDIDDLIVFENIEYFVLVFGVVVFFGIG